MSRKELAVHLFNKIEVAAAPIAVFVRNGAVKTTKITTDLYTQAMSKTPERLMGVYDENCCLEWLEEDLEWMGVPA